MPVIKQESYEDRSVYVVHWGGQRWAFDFKSLAQCHIIFSLHFLQWIE